jgi:hypothetical protein
MGKVFKLQMNERGVVRRWDVSLSRFFTNNSLNEQKVHQWSHQSKRTQAAERSNDLSGGVAALIGFMTSRNPGLAAIAATGKSVSQANKLAAFINHTIRGSTQNECIECDDGVRCVLGFRQSSSTCCDVASGEQRALAAALQRCEQHDAASTAGAEKVLVKSTVNVPSSTHC